MSFVFGFNSFLIMICCLLSFMALIRLLFVCLFSYHGYEKKARGEKPGVWPMCQGLHKPGPAGTPDDPPPRRRDTMVPVSSLWVDVSLLS